MHNMLIDKKIKTVLGTYKVSIRSGEKMLVLLSGAASFDTEQTFRPIINLLPENIGVFAIDYINSGLSSTEVQPFDLVQEATVIANLIKKQQAKQIILVGHSLGGLYALHIVKQLDNVIGFIGIEPLNSESVLNPPHGPAYRKVEMEVAKLSEEGKIQLVKDRVYENFPKSLADEIWQTHILDEAREDEVVEEKHRDNWIETIKQYSEIMLPKTLPSILISQSFRANEYRRSEYYTDNSVVVSAGNFHQIHWEHPDIVARAIKTILGDEVL